MKILVTGGAGYVGSHTVKALHQAGHEVFVYDNLSTGPSEALHKGIRFFLGDVRDLTLLSRIMKDSKIEAVVHLAAKLNIQESVRDPLSYYETNVFSAHNIAKAMATHQVKYLLFASSAAVYGDQVQDRALTETDPKKPSTPYGFTKVMSEQIFQDASLAHGFHYSFLRYFNPAGAALDNSNGQRTKEAFHLIHLAAQTAAGKRSKFEIHGNDFKTSDGTAIRDFIHIEDLADLHVKALNHLVTTQQSNEFNCGYGQGYSVQEVVTMMKKVSGVDFPVTYKTSHPATAPVLVANISKAKKELGWEPKHNSLETICRTAFEWEKSFKG